MSDLLEFLEAWYEWATVVGAPQGEPFLRECGLCDNIENHEWNCSAHWDGFVAMDDLRRLFVRDGLSSKYPFGERNYRTRHLEDTQHECPERLEWVRKTIAELESTGNSGADYVRD